jgi:ubiquinone/menaquinone biosynthesis C-methylase UbiE
LVCFLLSGCSGDGNAGETCAEVVEMNFLRRELAFCVCLSLVASRGYGQPADELPEHQTDAKAYHKLVESKLKRTYPATAERMLRECGNVRDGICIDIGCGTGRLDVELAKRSNLQIIGLDINPEMRPYFEKHVREAGFGERIRFLEGDAQELPFPDDYADVIVSRGTIIFIPDLAKCLQEVARVLKPTGVAFLGGRYLYAPSEDKMSNEDLREIVERSGVPDAKVITERGQWVKIPGPQASQTARQSQLGPDMLAQRCLVDYGIRAGDCLVVCGNDGGLTHAVQRGFLERTDFQMTALYPKEDVVAQARNRIDAAGQNTRITCRVGNIEALPFADASFDFIVGAGPMLIFSKRQQAMQELHRVLKPGGVALVGGRFLHMPEQRRVSSETLLSDAMASGIKSIRILDDMGQWVEIRKP